jgi:protein ImuA
MLTLADKIALPRALLARRCADRTRDFFPTGLAALDAIAPSGGLQWGAIHELLFDGGLCVPRFPALLLARAAQGAGGGVAVFSDPRRELHPTAIAMAGVDLRRVILLRPRNRGQEISALAECLRCKGVSATLTLLDRLGDIEARRLQLAAEAGGGVGVFMRPQARNKSPSASHYAAATRWRVRPVLKDETDAMEDGDTQSWIIELLHGHGGRLGESVLLEVDRETGDVRKTTELRETSDVRAASVLAHRPRAAPPARATA